MVALKDVGEFRLGDYRSSTWLSSRSGGTPNTARIRSYASSGRRGRSLHELTITGWEQTRNRDCLSSTTAAAVFVCSATTGTLSGSHLNRLNWLPFKSALTLEASIAFANAEARAATTKEPADMEEAQELEVKLVNLFFKGDPNPALRRAWAAYRRRLLLHHRVEG